MWSICVCLSCYLCGLMGRSSTLGAPGHETPADFAQAAAEDCPFTGVIVFFFPTDLSPRA